MIQVTDEMIDAYWKAAARLEPSAAPGRVLDVNVHVAGIAAVLAIVERDEATLRKKLLAWLPDVKEDSYILDKDLRNILAGRYDPREVTE